MRCKQGDMAIVLKGPYSGHFVTVKKFIGTARVRRGNGSYVMADDLWEVDAPTIPLLPQTRAVAEPDTCLLPIRPGDLQEKEETEKGLSARHDS